MLIGTVDYLLLKHEQRFSHYRALFSALTNASDELLRHPIATPQPLASTGGNSSRATTSLALQPCTDADPAHLGRLDPAQQWALDGSGALRSLARTRFASCSFCRRS